MASKQELAIIYAISILEDDGVSITVENVNKLLQVAGVQVEPVWSGLYVKALEGVNVSLISNSRSGANEPAAAAPADDAAPAKDEEPEAKEESDDDMGFGLFD